MEVGLCEGGAGSYTRSSVVKSGVETPISLCLCSIQCMDARIRARWGTALRSYLCPPASSLPGTPFLLPHPPLPHYVTLCSPLPTMFNPPPRLEAKPSLSPTSTPRPPPSST